MYISASWPFRCAIFFVGERTSRSYIHSTHFYIRKEIAYYPVSQANLFSELQINTRYSISGTGVEAGNLYPVNLGKLLAADDRFDPVYVNVPGNNLKEIPIQAEYTAYAANYISALTNRKTAYITWSQGSLDAQVRDQNSVYLFENFVLTSLKWAFKYWPSVVDSVTDSINVSPDYHGTIEAYLLCNEVMNPLGTYNTSPST